MDRLMDTSAKYKPAKRLNYSLAGVFCPNHKAYGFN